MPTFSYDLSALTVADDNSTEDVWFAAIPGWPGGVGAITSWSLVVDIGGADPGSTFPIAGVGCTSDATYAITGGIPAFADSGTQFYIGMEDFTPPPAGVFAADSPFTVTVTPDDPEGFATQVEVDNGGLQLVLVLVDATITPQSGVGVTLTPGMLSVTYDAGGGGGGGGPTAPEAVPSTISVEVWDEDNAVKVVDLDESFGRSWQDRANETGTAKVSVLNDNANADELTVGRHLRFSYGDDLAFTALIGDGDVERTLASAGEDADAVTTVSSPGHVAEWDLATVQPVNGVAGMPSSDRRTFSWASPEMDVGAWNLAYQYLGQISRQINLDPPWHEPWFPPKGWPYPLSAEWMWTMNRGVTFPPGIGLFARDFTLAEDTLVSHFIAADGRCRLYVDGMIAHDWTEQWPVQSFLSTYWCPIQMSAGVHRLALEVEVYDGLLALAEARPPRGMVTWCAHAETGTGAYLPGTVLGSALASEWRAFDVANAGGVTPAPTPHQIVAAFLAEAQAEDMLDGWSLSSTATTDSAGVAWVQPVPITVSVGSSGLDLLRALAAVSVDWWAQPAGKVLHLFNRGGRGVEVAAAAIEAEVNAYELVRTA